MIRQKKWKFSQAKKLRAKKIFKSFSAYAIIVLKYLCIKAEWKFSIHLLYIVSRHIPCESKRMRDLVTKNIMRTIWKSDVLWEAKKQNKFHCRLIYILPPLNSQAAFFGGHNIRYFFMFLKHDDILFLINLYGKLSLPFKFWLCQQFIFAVINSYPSAQSNTEMNYSLLFFQSPLFLIWNYTQALLTS